MVDAKSLISAVERDGFFILEDFLPVSDVLATREDLARMLDEDYSIREMQKQNPGAGIPDKYQAWISEHQHNLSFPSIPSPRLATLIDFILGHDLIKEFTDAVLGKHFRIRIDLVRRLTGVNDRLDDFQVPHNWHRDSPGEFTFGIFFDDVRPINSGATIGIAGTHRLAYNPIWDTMWPDQCFLGHQRYLAGDYRQISPKMKKVAVFSQLLKKRMKPRVREMSGKPGDIFFFLNDLWHGRAPNVHGTKNIIVRFGGFPTDFPFKDDIPLPASMGQLPPNLAGRYRTDQPANTDPTTFVRRLVENRDSSFFVRAAVSEQRTLAFGSRLLRMTI